jgi:hypothetical protein
MLNNLSGDASARPHRLDAKPKNLENRGKRENHPYATG